MVNNFIKNKDSSNYNDYKNKNTPILKTVSKPKRNIQFHENIKDFQEIPNKENHDLWNYGREEDRIVPFSRLNGSRYGGKSKKRSCKNK